MVLAGRSLLARARGREGVPGCGGGGLESRVDAVWLVGGRRIGAWCSGAGICGEGFVVRVVVVVVVGFRALTAGAKVDSVVEGEGPIADETSLSGTDSGAVCWWPWV